uniref:SET domain-containing protein n=1 Tax=Kalanchoe fedtschenkoi TaxID=63787 RepID=A0A7N0V7R4_KALFE
MFDALRRRLCQVEEARDGPSGRVYTTAATILANCPDEPLDDEKAPDPLCISAKNYGNVSRFMNHSCWPNVFWQPIMYENNGESTLHIAFFARKNIPPMTELTYDYGISLTANHDTQGSSDVPRGRHECLCKSEKCKGYFG